MNPIISDLITELENSTRGVVTVSYVLSRLRESQSEDYKEIELVPIYSLGAFV